MYRGKNLSVVNFNSKEPTFDNRVLLSSFYIAGYSRAGWVEWMGWLMRCRRILVQPCTRGISPFWWSLMNSTSPLYSLHERIWHWLQAAGMISLILTGMAIHYPDRFGIFGSMANAVRWHSWIGFAMIVNAFLGIFYHVTAEKYHHFLPRMDDFTGAAVRQARFYFYGIFKGREASLRR